MVSSVNTKKAVVAGIAALSVLAILKKVKDTQTKNHKKKQQQNAGTVVKLPIEIKTGDQKRKGQLNQKFLKELWTLIKIVLPGVFTKEAVLLAFHTLALAIRTVISIQVANLEGKIVKAIVDKKKRAFVYRLGEIKFSTNFPI